MSGWLFGPFCIIPNLCQFVSSDSSRYFVRLMGKRGLSVVGCSETKGNHGALRQSLSLYPIWEHVDVEALENTLHFGFVSCQVGGEIRSVIHYLFSEEQVDLAI